MTRWLMVSALQSEPIDLGQDDQSRQVYAINVLVTRRRSATFLLECLNVLEDAGVGVRGSTLFGSSKAAVPTGDGPFASVIVTGGSAPLKTQNANAAIDRSTAQVVVRGRVEPAVRAKTRAALDALVAVVNQDVDDA